LISFIGLSSESVTGEYADGWFTVSEFATSTNLLGTMLDCDIHIHLLRIVTDLLGMTVVGRLIEILGIFLDDVDLIVNPTLSGYVTADLLTENSAISLDTSSLMFSEGSTQKTVEMTVLGGAAQSGIRLSNMRYNIEFSTGWSVGLDFSDFMNIFVSDAEFYIGNFPTITVSSEDHEISAETTTGYEQYVMMSITESPSTTTPTSGTSSPTGPAPPIDLGGLLVIVSAAAGAVIVIVVVLIMKKKS
jgi:hypothetical protein